MKTERLSALDLTLAMGCSLNCKYCPQSVLINEYYKEDRNRKRKLNLTDFKIVLDKVEPGSTIGFAGMSEPFLNEECADMIVYADKKGYKISLYTTLVGMTFEDFEKIKNINFDRFVLHIPDEEKNSQFVITEEYIELFKLVHEKIKIDFYSCHGSAHSAVRDIIDKKKNASLQAQNRAGNLEMEGLDDYNKKGKIVCYRAWSSTAMNVSWTPELLPDGSLLLCCQDYGMKHKLGNLIEQSWEEIQEGKEFKKYIAGLTDDTIDLLCRKCVCAKTVEELPPLQLKRSVLNRKEGKTCEGLSPAVSDLVERFARADNVCVFGLGKLFKEHFFQEYWHEGLNVTVLSDNNPEYQGTFINGIECVKPEQLKKYDNLLVVLFVKSRCSEIRSQLYELGISNCITIDEVLDKSNLLCREKNRG